MGGRPRHSKMIKKTINNNNYNYNNTCRRGQKYLQKFCKLMLHNNHEHATEQILRILLNA